MDPPLGFGNEMGDCVLEANEISNNNNTDFINRYLLVAVF